MSARIKTCGVLKCRKPRKKKSPWCACHAQRDFRAFHPLSSMFAIVKASARRRGIEFTATREDFAELLKGGAVWGGNESYSLTVDRIRNGEGYVPGNLQLLTREENAVKQARRDERRMEAGYARRGGR